MFKFLINIFIILIIITILYLVIKKNIKIYESFNNLVKIPADHDYDYYFLKPDNNCQVFELSDNLIENAIYTGSFTYSNSKELNNILKNNINNYHFKKIN